MALGQLQIPKSESGLSNSYSSVALYSISLDFICSAKMATLGTATRDGGGSGQRHCYAVLGQAHRRMPHSDLDREGGARVRRRASLQLQVAAEAAREDLVAGEHREAQDARGEAHGAAVPDDEAEAVVEREPVDRELGVPEGVHLVAQSLLPHGRRELPLLVPLQRDLHRAEGICDKIIVGAAQMGQITQSAGPHDRDGNAMLC
mmetsp:Transcript_11578/g.30731  ORF Transcript_11578/g.30731 Transcript_11578/m.30731 type:complete len:204 (+) Transcript_11578:433-1044(+)